MDCRWCAVEATLRTVILHVCQPDLAARALKSSPSPVYDWFVSRAHDAAPNPHRMPAIGAPWKNSLFNAIRALDISSGAPV